MSNNNAKILKTARIKAEKEIKSMVTIMGNDALNHFEASFRNQGFTNETLVRWQPRKGEIVGGISRLRSRERGARGILIGKGTATLKKSLRRRRLGQYAIRISSNVIYANVHNEGLRAGRGSGFIMPKRQFVGYSAKLNRSLINKFNMKIHSIF